MSRWPMRQRRADEKFKRFIFPELHFLQLVPFFLRRPFPRCRLNNLSKSIDHFLSHGRFVNWLDIRFHLWQCNSGVSAYLKAFSLFTSMSRAAIAVTEYRVRCSIRSKCLFSFPQFFFFFTISRFFFFMIN